MGKPGRTFFSGCYKELSKAQATGHQADIDKLIRRATPSVRKYAQWMKTRHHTVPVDMDDYLQEGLLALYRFILKYRYICPVCGDEYASSAEYAKHGKSEHGKVIKVRSTLESYLNFRIKRYMRNLMLRYYKAESRLSAATVCIEDYEYDLVDPSVLPDSVAVTNERIRNLKGELEREANQKVRFFVQACLTGAEPGDIYVGLVDAGLLGTTASARVAISNLRRRGEFERYRPCLVESNP